VYWASWTKMSAPSQSSRTPWVTVLRSSGAWWSGRYARILPRPRCDNQACSRVWDGAGPHLGRTDSEVLVVGVHEANFAAKLGHLDREKRRLHGAQERLFQAAFALAGTVDVQHSAGIVERSEEGQAHDVIEVEVGEQSGRLQGATVGPQSGLEHVTESSEAGAEIEDQRLVALDGDQKTGGVAAIAAVTFA